jgi:hypothetical protein
MTTTQRFAAVILATIAILGLSATVAAAATPSTTVTDTVRTTSKGTETCRIVKTVKESGDYRSETTCRKSKGGSSHKVAIKVGRTVTSTSDTVSVSSKGNRTTTHTMTVTIAGKRASQTQTQK